VSSLSGKPRFPDDDGSADPRAAAALAAFAAGGGSEHAVLTALAGSRLLIPLVAVLADEATAAPADGAATEGPAAAPAGPAVPVGPAVRAGPAAGGGEKSSDMALPKLVGRDGRPAIPAFTCVDSLNRWRPGARPVPAEAAAVWRTAADETSAVVIDVAGPVPLAIEGARLAALARGDDVPLPQHDPDVRDAVAAAVAEQAPGASFRLLAGGANGDLVIELELPPALAGGQGLTAGQSAGLAGRVGSAAMARLGSRLRRGIAIALVPGG
jgi:hypothetical protein